MKCLEIARLQDFAPNSQGLLGALSGPQTPLPYRTNPPLKISAYGPACYTVKIYKNKPQFFFKPGARRSLIRLCYLEYQNFIILYICLLQFWGRRDKTTLQIHVPQFHFLFFFKLSFIKLWEPQLSSTVSIISLHTCSWNYFFHHR